MEHGLPVWFKEDQHQLPKLNMNLPDELIYDLPFEKYLGDRSAVSSSGLRKILKSPQHYLAEVCGYAKDEEEEKDAYRFGRAAHMLILEPMKFKELYVVEPEFIGFTKDGRASAQSGEAKAKRQAWRDSLKPDALVLSKQEMDTLIYMIDSLAYHQRAGALLRDGKPEVTGFFTHKETGLRVRIRPDYLTQDKQGRIYISDLKTTRDASAGLFAHDVGRFKYHLQLALYYDGIKQITGKEPEAAAFIAIEKSAPYSCAVYWMNEDDLAIGRGWYEHALRTLKRCIEKNDWPGVQHDAAMIELPQWAQNEVFPIFEWADESK